MVDSVAVVVTFVVTIAAIAAFASNRIPIGVVAVGVSLALFFTGTVTFEQAIAGFGDPVVVYIAALFVVSEALDATGVTAWAGRQLIKRAGTGINAVLLWMMVLVAIVTAMISVNGAVAALVPVGVVLALRVGKPPSQLLIPLAFAAHAGSMLALTGTPVNLLVSELAVDAGSRHFGFFEFAIVGIPLLAGTIVIVLLFGAKLLPDRVPEYAPRDLSRHAQTVSLHYALEEGAATIEQDAGFFEAMIPPRSPFIGDSVFPGMRTEDGALIITAIHRAGEHITDATKLRAGDVLLMHGSWEELERRAADPRLLTVDAPLAIRRQAAGLGSRAYLASAVLIGMLVLLATSIVPAAIAALAAAAMMMLLRALTVQQAHRSISITTLLVVAGMIPLSTAMQESGAADLIADGIVNLLGHAGPHVLLLGIVVVVAVLGQFISNMATVLVVAPIAITVAAQAGYSPLPFLMGIAVVGAGAFLTPVATPANLMVLAPGAYHFGDYWRLGLPLLSYFILMGTVVVPLIWQF